MEKNCKKVFHFCTSRNPVCLIVIFLMVAAAAACGSENGSKSRIGGGASALDIGSAKVVVSRSRSADARKSYGVIKKYTVAVSGDGVSEPITKEFNGDAESGVVDGIPAGTNRVVSVEAVNMGDKLIRMGGRADVTIVAGEVTEVEIEMSAVPIFTNLADGNIVASTRLRFEVFADSDDPLEIHEISGASPHVLMDIATGLSEIFPDKVTGLGIMTPQPISAGDYRFRVASKKSGYFSEVSIKIVDGEKIHPAPMYSGGEVWTRGEYVGLSRAGSSIHAGSRSGAVWPNLVGYMMPE